MRHGEHTLAKGEIMARAVMTLIDESLEKTTVAVTSQALSAGNFAAQETAWTALRAAIQALTLGGTVQHSLGQVTPLSYVVPTDAFAQRELKWLVTYTGDTSGKSFQIEIGSADLAGGRKVAGSDKADMTHADWQAFKTAFEAFARSPDDLTETVTVTGATFVGRNL